MDIRDWLRNTTAAEIMVRNMVTVAPQTKLAEVAGILLHESISGAPVVDSHGVCVGVLSISDILGADEKVAQERQRVAESDFFTTPLVLPASVVADQLAAVRDKIAPAEERPIERFMTTDVVSVAVDAPLERVIQDMVDAHIHRILVFDEDQRLQGIISTTDVLAALLRQKAPMS
jgi:CBS-domain-containing membrane protein